jgi:hypothetical protein
MKKKPPISRLFASKTGPRSAVLNRRNVTPQDLFLYARSFHAAAKKLAEAFESGSSPFTDFNACPVVFMYRHALELHLKALVLGDGGNSLATKPDPLSVHKTHSVSWLTQFVCQILTALKWEPEFRCVGIENLDDFKAVVESVNSVDPGSYVCRIPNVAISEFARKMDALLDLLDSTGDALAAEWDLRLGAVPELESDDSGFGPTIQ